MAKLSSAQLGAAQLGKAQLGAAQQEQPQAGLGWAGFDNFARDEGTKKKPCYRAGPFLGSDYYLM